MEWEPNKHSQIQVYYYFKCVPVFLLLKACSTVTDNKSRAFSCISYDVLYKNTIILTGAIEACSNGVQKSVLGGQEALHHWHSDPNVGRPTAGLKSPHPGVGAGVYQGVPTGGRRTVWGWQSGHGDTHLQPSFSEHRLSQRQQRWPGGKCKIP